MPQQKLLQNIILDYSYKKVLYFRLQNAFNFSLTRTEKMPNFIIVAMFFIFFISISEVDGTGSILEWGFCTENCPSDDPINACLEIPKLPPTIYDENGLFRNYSTNYDIGLRKPVHEMDYISFECPLGYSYVGSNHTTVYAYCHNWTFIYTFNESSYCSRK